MSIPVSSPAPGAAAVPASESELRPRTHISERRFASHQRITIDCDPTSRILEILEGTVILTRLLPDGRRQVIEILEPGMLIGILREERQSVIAETRTPVRIRIHEVRDGKPDGRLQSLYAVQMNDRLRLLHELTLSMSRKTAAERVASFLLQRAGLTPERAFAMTDAAPVHVRLNLSQTDIADYLGLRAETVCRILTDMKRQSLLVQAGQGRLTLTNVAEIAARAERPRGSRDEKAVSISDESARTNRRNAVEERGAA